MKLKGEANIIQDWSELPNKPLRRAGLPKTFNWLKCNNTCYCSCFCLGGMNESHSSHNLSPIKDLGTLLPPPSQTLQQPPGSLRHSK